MSNSRRMTYLYCLESNANRCAPRKSLDVDPAAYQRSRPPTLDSVADTAIIGESVCRSTAKIGEGNLGDTGPYAPVSLHAATAAHCSSLPAALRLEPGEPVGTALERRGSCGRPDLEAAANQAATSLSGSCCASTGPEPYWADADSHHH